MSKMPIVLWVVPPEDFTAYCEFTGNAFADHAAYATQQAAAQAELERQGYEVRRSVVSVSRMREELVARGLANTPGNRAAIAALLANDAEKKE